MPAFLKILLLFALLQGCALEVRETAETTQSAQEREQLARAHQEQAQRLWLRAQEFEQQRDFIRSANELISYQAYLDQDADIRANTAKIWGLLNRADRKSLEQRYGADPQALSGWLELAVIKRLCCPTPKRWRARWYPGRKTTRHIPLIQPSSENCARLRCCTKNGLAKLPCCYRCAAHFGKLRKPSGTALSLPGSIPDLSGLRS